MWGFPEADYGDTSIVNSEATCHNSAMGKSVLVVDDYAPFREVVGQLLRARGFHIAGNAVDEDQAIEAVQTLQPDAILLDAHLAAPDDFALVRRLSGTEDRIPVLLTSSDPDVATDLLAHECGAVGFVPKTELVSADLQRLFTR